MSEDYEILLDLRKRIDLFSDRLPERHAEELDQAINIIDDVLSLMKLEGGDE